MSLVTEWAVLYQEELKNVWTLAKEEKPLKKIVQKISPNMIRVDF